jgi:hypothetical protein
MHSARKFGLMVGGVLLALGGIGLWRHHTGIAARIALIAGVSLAVLGVLAPRALTPLERVWMRTAAVLGWLNTRILLTALFLLVFTPLALVRRLLGKDSLDRRFEPDRATYWHDRLGESSDPQRYRRQF